LTDLAQRLRVAGYEQSWQARPTVVDPDRAAASSRDGKASAFLDRLERVEPRLRAHPDAPPYPGLTDPDPGTGEQWEGGQVWAHLVEILPYWMGQVRALVAGASPEPAPFGRVKANAARIDAIEAGRHVPPPAQMEALAIAIDELRRLLESLPAQA